jgi:hypothetical protein
MCIECYHETWATDLPAGWQRTKPLCDHPRDGLMSRQSGWFCAGCAHWHPYPRPTEVQPLRSQAMPGPTGMAD